MHIEEVYMRLESLKHLRDMPKLRRLRDRIEADLAEIQDKVSPKEEEQAPATVEPVDPPSEPPASADEAERRV